MKFKDITAPASTPINILRDARDELVAIPRPDRNWLAVCLRDQSNAETTFSPR